MVIFREVFKELRARHKGKKMFRAGWEVSWHVVLFYILARRSGTSNCEIALGATTRQGAKGGTGHSHDRSLFDKMNCVLDVNTCIDNMVDKVPSPTLAGSLVLWRPRDMLYKAMEFIRTCLDAGP